MTFEYHRVSRPKQTDADNRDQLGSTPDSSPAEKTVSAEPVPPTPRLSRQVPGTVTAESPTKGLFAAMPPRYIPEVLSYLSSLLGAKERHGEDEQWPAAEYVCRHLRTPLAKITAQELREFIERACISALYVPPQETK